MMLTPANLPRIRAFSVGILYNPDFSPIKVNAKPLKLIKSRKLARNLHDTWCALISFFKEASMRISVAFALIAMTTCILSWALLANAG